MNKKEREKFFLHMGSLDLMFKTFEQRMESGEDSSSIKVKKAIQKDL